MINKSEKKVRLANGAKNDTFKIVLLYLSLVFLVIMLFVPPMLRLLVKDVEEEKPKVVLSVLNCTREGEVIITAYSDNNPYNFYYSIEGDYTQIDFNSEEETDENDEQNEDDDKQNEDVFNYQNVMIDVISYSSITYNEMENKTEISMDISSETIKEILPQYSKLIDEQDTYYTKYGFTCTKTILD